MSSRCVVPLTMLAALLFGACATDDDPPQAIVANTGPAGAPDPGDPSVAGVDLGGEVLLNLPTYPGFAEMHPEHFDANGCYLPGPDYEPECLPGENAEDETPSVEDLLTQGVSVIELIGNSGVPVVPVLADTSTLQIVVVPESITTQTRSDGSTVVQGLLLNDSAQTKQQVNVELSLDAGARVQGAVPVTSVRPREIVPFSVVVPKELTQAALLDGPPVDDIRVSSSDADTADPVDRRVGIMPGPGYASQLRVYRGTAQNLSDEVFDQLHITIAAIDSDGRVIELRDIEISDATGEPFRDVSPDLAVQFEVQFDNIPSSTGESSAFHFMIWGYAK